MRQEARSLNKIFEMINMNYIKSKSIKSQNSIRNINHFTKHSPLKATHPDKQPNIPDQHKDYYNKENINPNQKENRVKSHNTRLDPTSNTCSPNKKVLLVKNTQKNCTLPIPIRTSMLEKQHQHIQKTNMMTQQTKSQKNIISKPYDSLTNFHKVTPFPEDYYPDKQKQSKEKKKEEKVKVTLKDIKRIRKSIQQNAEQLSKRNNKRVVEPEHDDKHESTFDQSKQTLQLEIQKCTNHHEKRATYQLMSENEQNLLYCTKCAVNLVTQGYKMKELAQNTSEKMKNSNNSISSCNIKEERLQKINGFISKLQQVEPTFQVISEHLKKYREALVKKGIRQEFTLNQYFANLIARIQELQRQSLQTVKMLNENILFEVDGLEETLQQNYDHILFLKEDILPNINSIVDQKSLSIDNFNIIIEEHDQKLRSIEDNLEQIQRASFQGCEFNEQQLNSILDQATFFKPEIMYRQVQLIQKHQESAKKQLVAIEVENYSRLDPFRMSFGKNYNQDEMIIF